MSLTTNKWTGERTVLDYFASQFVGLMQSDCTASEFFEVQEFDGKHHGNNIVEIIAHVLGSTLAMVGYFAFCSEFFFLPTMNSI